MEVKIKPIDKRNWLRVKEKDCEWISIQEQEGIAYLIRIKEVTEPLNLLCFGQNIKLADVGYYWLQIGLKNENYWLTAMYNEKGEFVQYYFDTTRKNFIDGKDSYFEDLFLDVVFQGGNKIEIIDLDELNQALLEQVISQEEYDLARMTAERIMKKILKNREEYDNLCLKYFNMLRKKIRSVC